MNSCEDWDDVRYGSLVGLLRAKFSQVIDLSNDCSNHDGFCIENGGFCIENDGFSMQLPWEHAYLATIATQVRTYLRGFPTVLCCGIRRAGSIRMKSIVAYFA